MTKIGNVTLETNCMVCPRHHDHRLIPFFMSLHQLAQHQDWNAETLKTKVVVIEGNRLGHHASITSRQAIEALVLDNYTEAYSSHRDELIQQLSSQALVVSYHDATDQMYSVHTFKIL